MVGLEERWTRPWGTLYSQRYEAATSGAEIVLVHGFGEHLGRYGALVQHLLTAGYSVTAYDHCGHGKSSGLYGHIDRFHQYEEDLHSVVSHVHDTYKPERLFLIGHSMGGLITLRYLLSPDHLASAAVISAPLIAIAAKVPLHKLLIAKVGALLAPRWRLHNEINPAVLSRDEEVGRAYAADPLVGKLVSTRWFAEAVKAMQELKSQASRITTPLLLMHGSEDKLASVEATKEVFSALASADKELTIYPGYYHELFNEPEKQEIFERVTAWLNARVGKE